MHTMIQQSFLAATNDYTGEGKGTEQVVKALPLMATVLSFQETTPFRLARLAGGSTADDKSSDLVGSHFSAGREWGRVDEKG